MNPGNYPTENSNLAGRNSPPGIGSNNAQMNTIDSLHGQVHEVIGICRDNVEKVIERDGKLTDLEDKCDELQVHSQQFQKTSAALKRKYWWKNTKMIIIIVIVLIIIIAIIIISATT